VPQIKSLIGDKCDGVIGQLTEVRGWRWCFFLLRERVKKRERERKEVN